MLLQQQHQNVWQVRPLFLVIFSLLMHTQKFQNFMVWIELSQKIWWISRICFNLYLEKIDEFWWWDIEIISADAGTLFTSTKFKEERQTCGVHLNLSAPDHQEMNGQDKETRSFCSNVYNRSYFSVLPIKDLIDEGGETTTSYKLATGMKPSVSHLRVLFCPCVVQKATAHVGTKALNMCHQS